MVLSYLSEQIRVLQLCKLPSLYKFIISFKVLLTSKESLDLENVLEPLHDLVDCFLGNSL